MLKNKKLSMGIVLLFLCTVLITSTINNTKHNRYVSEDMEQSINRLNKFFEDNRAQLHNILNSDQTPEVDVGKLSELMNFHREIGEELFNLEKKGSLLESDLRKRIQTISDEFYYDDEMNYDKIREYYESLEGRLGGNNYLELDENEIKELELIFAFYNNVKLELSKLKI